MCVRAAQHLAVELAGQRDVGAVAHLARDLFDAVVALADALILARGKDLVGFVGGGHISLRYRRAL